MISSMTLEWGFISPFIQLEDLQLIFKTHSNLKNLQLRHLANKNPLKGNFKESLMCALLSRLVLHPDNLSWP